MFRWVSSADVCLQINIEVVYMYVTYGSSCYSYRYDTDDEEVDDSECEEDEVNGNENDSDEEEGKTPFPLVMYTVYGLLLHLGHLCCKHGNIHLPVLRSSLICVSFASVPSRNEI